MNDEQIYSMIKSITLPNLHAVRCKIIHLHVFELGIITILELGIMAIILEPLASKLNNSGLLYYSAFLYYKEYAKRHLSIFLSCKNAAKLS